MPRADIFPLFDDRAQRSAVADQPARRALRRRRRHDAGAGAVINAMVDALSEFGVRHIEMPATPERVWRAIRGACSAPAD